MANTYFRFKQFTIHHDRCAMKVGTDGVLLGAWTNVENKKTALDVGSGSGLVSLMLAQRNKDLKIDALEIDSSAAEQSIENIHDSPFAKQISVLCTDFIQFAENIEHKYDLIVSNPPFFENSLKSPQQQRTTARHNDSLLPETLIRLSAKLLTSRGTLVVIYPFDLFDKILEIAQTERFFITKTCTVYPTQTSKAKRILIEMSLDPASTEESKLTIEIERHVYTEAFQNLTREFYLEK